jgi:hypothetical protein
LAASAAAAAAIAAVMPQAGRRGPDPAVLHTLRSCEVLECLTNGQLIMLAGMLQPVSRNNFTRMVAAANRPALSVLVVVVQLTAASACVAQCIVW